MKKLLYTGKWELQLCGQLLRFSSCWRRAADDLWLRRTHSFENAVIWSLGAVVKVRNTYCTSSRKWHYGSMWCAGQWPEGESWCVSKTTWRAALNIQPLKYTSSKMRHNVFLIFSVIHQQHNELCSAWIKVGSEWHGLMLNYETLFWCNYANVAPHLHDPCRATPAFSTGLEQGLPGLRALLTFTTI